MNFQGVRFFPYLQFEQPSVLRLPTHLNLNVVRIIKSVQNIGRYLRHTVFDSYRPPPTRRRESEKTRAFYVSIFTMPCVSTPLKERPRTIKMAVQYSNILRENCADWLGHLFITCRMTTLCCFDKNILLSDNNFRERN